MTETEAIQAATKPQDIISAQECNEILSYLTEWINVLVAFEWERRLIASQEKVKLLNNPEYTNAVAKAMWEVSKEYIEWQDSLGELRKFRAYKSDLKDKFSVLSNLKRY